MSTRNYDALPDTAHVTDREIADWLNISKATVWRWVKKKILPAPTRFTARCSRWKAGDIRKIADISAANQDQEAAA